MITILRRDGRERLLQRLKPGDKVANRQLNPLGTQSGWLVCVIVPKRRYHIMLELGQLQEVCQLLIHRSFIQHLEISTAGLQIALTLHDLGLSQRHAKTIVVRGKI